MEGAAALIAKIRKRGTMRLGYAEIVYLTIAERDLIVAALSAPPPLRAREEMGAVNLRVNKKTLALIDEAAAVEGKSRSEFLRDCARADADAILSSTAGQEWRDISSAPKDSRFIDLWHKKQGRLADCRWLKDDLPNKVGAWFGGRAFNMGLDDEFSHWMPLPAPPVVERTADELWKDSVGF